MRASTSFINNYAQTAFLKRYGVEYLPTIFVINAILVFVASNVLGYLMGRHKVIRVFTGLLLFFAASVLAIRLMLPTNLTILYPILFIIKTEAMSTLPLLYWNINNAIFSARQSKRIFSLIMAGGILGAVLGSLFTHKVATFVGVDNILYIFVVGMVLAALFNEKTEGIAGASMESTAIRRKKKGSGPFKELIKEVRETSKSSPFLKYLIILVAMPNIVVPFLLYEFNVVVDQTYATEKATLTFFSYFRGFGNALTFFALIISGRMISRFGVGTTLLFHPLNYLLAFGLLFFKFDIISGIYARFSTETIKTAFNIPSRAVLYNFIPVEVRSRVQVFLRGTVTKASSILGGVLLMFTKNFLEPSFLGLIIAPFVIFWVIFTFAVRRSYSSLLIKVLMRGQIDWKELEESTLRQLAQDKKTMEDLKKGLLGDSEQTALLCAEILSYAKPQGWPHLMVKPIAKWPSLQREFLELLDPEELRQIWPDIGGTIRIQEPKILLAAVPVLNRKLGSELVDFLRELTYHHDPRVQLQALLALHCDTSPEASLAFKSSLERVLRTLEEAGIPLHRGPSPEETFKESLKFLALSADPEIGALAICGMGKSGSPASWELAVKFLSDPRKAQQASDSIYSLIEEMKDFLPLEVLIGLLTKGDPNLKALASQAILNKGPDAIPKLLSSLSSPSRTLRREILKILDKLDVSPTELSNFVQQQMRSAYLRLEFLIELEKLNTDARSLDLLKRHLKETVLEIAKVILRVISVLEGGEKFRIILRAIQKKERKAIDNAIEALESAIKRDLRRGLVPLLEEIPLEEKIKVGRRLFGDLSKHWDSPNQALSFMATNEGDPILRALVIYLWAEETSMLRPLFEALKALDEEKDPNIQDAMCWYRTRTSVFPDKAPAQTPQPLPCIDKVFHLEKIPIFSDLNVKDLFSVAAIAEFIHASEGDILIREGEPGEVLYLIVQGRLMVMKGLGSHNERQIATLGSGEYFGEMSLFDERPRSASVVSMSNSQLLAIQKGPFYELMENNPLIPINICKAFSRRLRRIHQRIQAPMEHTLDTSRV